MEEISAKAEAKDSFSDFLQNLTHDEITVLIEFIEDLRKAREEQRDAQLRVMAKDGLLRGYEYQHKRKTIIS